MSQQSARATVAAAIANAKKRKFEGLNTAEQLLILHQTQLSILDILNNTTTTQENILQSVQARPLQTSSTNSTRITDEDKAWTLLVIHCIVNYSNSINRIKKD
jgi:hypothetical protein